MFNDNRVTGGQVRSQNAHQLIVREVPRLNRHQHADGMMLNPGVAQIGVVFHRRKEGAGIVGVVARNARTEFDFAAALLDQFAHLLGGNFRQLLGTLLQQIGKLKQHR